MPIKRIILISKATKALAVILLLFFSQPLTAQKISNKKKMELQNRLQCANLALLQNEKEQALKIYKEIRNTGQFCQIALIANDSLALNSYDNSDIETLYDCIKYSEKYLEISPLDERMKVLKNNYLKLYYAIRNNLVFQDDLCGIWVSDYTEDKHKSPYIILEIEKTDTGYIAHIHPNCQIAWKYPTYSYWGKYKYYKSSELPYAKCGGDWETETLNIHFADREYRKAHPVGANITAQASVYLTDEANKFLKSMTSDPDFFRSSVQFKAEVYGTSLAVAGVGLALGILSAILQNAKGYGYSIRFQGEHIVRGEIECILTEEVLEISTSTGKIDNKFKQVNMRMLRIYPDYDIRFIGYNNWLVGSHSFTNEEAKTYPEHKYRKQKILQHNTESYKRLFESFANSHKNSPEEIKTYIKNQDTSFSTANSGNIALGIIPTLYGQYYGELNNGEPIDKQAEHYFKQEKSLFIGIVKNNKREGEGVNHQYGDSTEIVRITNGTWMDGKLYGHVKQDDYVRHQHFEGDYSDGHRHGKGILIDTANNIIYEGCWDLHHREECLNGKVVEKNLNGEILFDGEYKNNHREGKGEEKYWDNSTYVGYWKKGLKHGKGELQIPEINENYKQTWKKGVLKYGKDIERNQDGEIVFNGEYKNDQRYGYGTERNEDGSFFEGHWKKGIKHGTAILHDSNKTYNQTWRRGIIKYGAVVERNQDGSVIYEGEYRYNKRDGYGIEYQKDGNVYKGNWRYGVKHGKGVLHDSKSNQDYNQTWSYGDLKHGMVLERNQEGMVIYEGEYRNNKRDGYGTEYYGNGRKYEGYWKNGVKHGKGIFYIPNTNESYEEVWENGIIMKSKTL